MDSEFENDDYFDYVEYEEILRCQSEKVEEEGIEGAHGQGQKHNGAEGEDVVVRVPPGTNVREADGDVRFVASRSEGIAITWRERLSNQHGKGVTKSKKNSAENKFLLLHLGFLLPHTSHRAKLHLINLVLQLKLVADVGLLELMMFLAWWLVLQLKLVADVGLVGAPIAGKSTLVSVISADQPAIANIPSQLCSQISVWFHYDATLRHKKNGHHSKKGYKPVGLNLIEELQPSESCSGSMSSTKDMEPGDLKIIVTMTR
ncbi:unnamed protein product [Fraxinus pennsylvanica]|uniref:Obg domain-containing protein n=1 Tax=Fraxinus pennsylvanica TaxID=56036 RepID=A0AAD1ZAJ3_9LAMI|nr:unnamed protein product [Fraxinus pennsylvanica]